MAASLKSVRATFKIAAIYVFALSTAVACSKFELKKAGGGGTVLGTANGNVAVVREGNTGGAPTELTVTIDKITPTPMGLDELGQSFVHVQVEMSHGARKLAVSTYPQVLPYIQDKAKKTEGSVEYSAETICGNDTCTKFGVMINVVDSSNGADFQRVEIWDTSVSTTAPQKRLTQTAFTTITVAYETMTGAGLNGTPVAVAPPTYTPVSADDPVNYEH